MRFLEGQPPDLALGTRFKWKTGFLNPDTKKSSAFGLTVEYKIVEFLPPERLAYDAHATGFDGYQAWLIEKTETGCRVLTGETQRGLLARFLNTFASNRMIRQHQVWLETLKDNAAKGLPP